MIWQAACPGCRHDLIAVISDHVHELERFADRIDLNIVRRQRLIHHNQTQVQQRLDRLARLGLPTPERDKTLTINR